MHQQDAIIIATIGMIADHHGCKLTNANIVLNKDGEKMGLIEIDGPEEKRQALAQAIDDALKSFESI